jgi:hypothetical protein
MTRSPGHRLSVTDVRPRRDVRDRRVGRRRATVRSFRSSIAPRHANSQFCDVQSPHSRQTSRAQARATP